jgi:tRNA(Glu) U13 pseudouridine synthase TruD
VLVGEPKVESAQGDQREHRGAECGLVLGFFLPKGCYATTVLEELLKRPVS